MLAECNQAFMRIHHILVTSLTRIARKADAAEAAGQVDAAGIRRTSSGGAYALVDVDGAGRPLVPARMHMLCLRLNAG